MKKTFFLYFLVLSPLLFSQNNLQFKVEGYSISSLDKNLSYETSNLSYLTPIEPIHEKEISSLEIIRQLEELNYKTPFNLIHNPTLERFIRVYLKTRRDNLSLLMGRAEYYFPIFEKYLDQFDLPLEIKYLAIVESALDPIAISPSGAKGIWQFMLNTGKQYNLEVNSYVDERFNVIKSTIAACKYLSSLYNTFQDWDLALAAYNSGPGNVNKAILRSGGSRNYWKIRQFLPQETRSYVPAFYATYYIFEFAESHQLKPNFSGLKSYTSDTVHIKKPLSFKTIQKTLAIDHNILKYLNPEYKKGFIPFSKRNIYILRLPKNKIETFISNESQLYKNTAKNVELIKKTNSLKITISNSYEVQIGDNLNEIAKKYNITLKHLKIWNGLETNYLITGQRLVITNKPQTIPFSLIPSTKYASLKTQNFKSKNPKNYETYTVKKGDTLFNISRRYLEVSVDEIRNWNNITNVKFLKPGTKLKIFKS